MQKYNNILAFIDVDNCGMTNESYDNIIFQLSSLGEITTAKIYGVNQKKHGVIIEHASENGYDVAMPMRIKKRGSKVLDTRIIVDIMSTVYTTDNIDAVAIVCAPSDLVYLYRELKKKDISVLALDNSDDATNALIDEVLDLGIVMQIKLPKPRVAKPKVTVPVVSTPVAETVVSPFDPVADPTVFLVREPVVDSVVELGVEQAIDQSVEPAIAPVETIVESQPDYSSLNETEKLLAEIAKLRQVNSSLQSTSESPATIITSAIELKDLVEDIKKEQVTEQDTSDTTPAEQGDVVDVQEQGQPDSSEQEQGPTDSSEQQQVEDFVIANIQDDIVIPVKHSVRYEVPDHVIPRTAVHTQEQPQEDVAEVVIPHVTEKAIEDVVESASYDRSLTLDNKDDGNLLKRIQAVRDSAEGDDEELIALLKKLLLETH